MTKLFLDKNEKYIILTEGAFYCLIEIIKEIKEKVDKLYEDSN